MQITPENLQLFSLLLGTPEPESLALLEGMSDEHDWLCEPVEELKRLPLEQWQAEHTSLFINGYPHTLAPPFLSALQNGEMGGDTAERVSKFYHYLGLEADSMPADYLGTLFECAAWLLQIEREAQQPAFEQLWNDFLCPILPGFATRLIEYDGLKLYTRMGQQLERLSRPLLNQSETIAR